MITTIVVSLIVCYIVFVWLMELYYSLAYPKHHSIASNAALHVQLSREVMLEREVKNLREKVAAYEREMGKQGGYR